MRGKDRSLDMGDPVRLYDEPLPKLKRRMKTIASDLCYPLEVRVAIDKAKSAEAIDRIMHDAREKY